MLILDPADQRSLHLTSSVMKQALTLLKVAVFILLLVAHKYSKDLKKDLEASQAQINKTKVKSNADIIPQVAIPVGSGRTVSFTQ
jgi:hypothetical protein